jgi:hypothetical protein
VDIEAKTFTVERREASIFGGNENPITPHLTQSLCGTYSGFPEIWVEQVIKTQRGKAEV